jgi:hypothetical protein
MRSVGVDKNVGQVLRGSDFAMVVIVTVVVGQREILYDRVSSMDKQRKTMLSIDGTQQIEWCIRAQ